MIVHNTGPCVRGCTIRGEHNPTCEGECRGCLPRPTAIGNLCQSCYNRVEYGLTELTVRVPWLEILGRNLAMNASAAPQDGETFMRGDPSEGSVLHAAFLRADEIRSDLDNWVGDVRDKRNLHGDPIDDPAKWLLPHLPWIADTDAAETFAGEVLRDVGQAMAWPTPADVEPSKHLDVPCPRCATIALVYTPPRWEGQPARVECTEPDCARVYTEDEWDEIKKLALLGVA